MSEGILRGNRGILRTPPPPRRIPKTAVIPPPLPKSLPIKRGIRCSSKSLASWIPIICTVAVIFLGSVVYLAMNQNQNSSVSSARIKSGKGSVKIGESFEVATEGTKFSVIFTGVWFTDSKLNEENKREFLVAYSYKNLGPREASFSIFPWAMELDPNAKKEIYAKDGRIFSGYESRGGCTYGGWKHKDTKTVNETGEKALIFKIPEDAVPEKVVVQRNDGYTFILLLKENNFPVKQKEKDFKRS